MQNMRRHCREVPRVRQRMAPDLRAADAMPGMPYVGLGPRAEKTWTKSERDFQMIERQETQLSADNFEISVLATLPNERMEFITIETISDDFNLPNNHRVASAIRRLIAAGHPISVEVTRFGRIVWLHSKNKMTHDLALGHMKIFTQNGV